MAYTESHVSTTNTAFRYALVAALAAAYILAAYALGSGTPLGGVILAILVGGPIGFLLWLRWPIILPFGIYVVLVPFDNLLSIGSFGTLTKLLGLVAGVALFLALLARQKFVSPTPAVLVLFGLLAWMAMTITWSVDTGDALKIMPTYFAIFALYAILAIAPPNRAEFKMTMLLVVVGGVAAALYGINLFYHDPSLAADPEKTRLVLHTDSATIDPNQFSDALLFPAALITMWGLRSGRMLIKAIAFGGLSVLAVGILVSGSREALLALGLMMGYFAFRSRYRAQLLVPFAALCVALISTQSSIWDRFTKLFSTGGAGRADIWKVGIEAAKHRPIQGYGIGNFQDAYDIFYLRIHQTYPYGFSSPAHNLVFHYVVELGVIGFAIMIAWFWLNVKVLRSIPPENEWYDHRIAMEAGFLGVLTVSLTIDLFTYKYAWLVFMLIVMLGNIAKAAQSANAQRDLRHDAGAIGAVAQAPPALEPNLSPFGRRQSSELA